MAFNVSPPNDLGPRPNTGGAMPGPLSRGGDPTPPNETGGDREQREGASIPSVGGFVSPPNNTSREPGRGGKI